MREKEMEGVKTGEACSHDLGEGFSQTCVHKDTLRPPVLLSPRLTSPSQECPSAASALEPRNAPLLKLQYVCVFSSHPETMSAAKGRREPGACRGMLMPHPNVCVCVCISV